MERLLLASPAILAEVLLTVATAVVIRSVDGAPDKFIPSAAVAVAGTTADTDSIPTRCRVRGY
jgi:hypothetical protein